VDAARLHNPGQMLRHESDGHSAFTHCRSDHPGRSRSHITYGEHAGPASLDQERSPAKGGPPFALAQFGWQRRTGEDKPIFVEGNLSGQPIRAWRSSDQHDHHAGINGLLQGGGFAPTGEIAGGIAAWEGAKLPVRSG
jgi:hypothetical protein